MNFILKYSKQQTEQKEQPHENQPNSTIELISKTNPNRFNIANTDVAANVSANTPSLSCSNNILNFSNKNSNEIKKSTTTFLQPINTSNNSLSHLASIQTSQIISPIYSNVTNAYLELPPLSTPTHQQASRHSSSPGLFSSNHNNNQNSLNLTNSANILYVGGHDNISKSMNKLSATFSLMNQNLNLKNIKNSLDTLNNSENSSSKSKF